VLSVAPASVGAVLQGGQTFFTLVPLNAPLEIDGQATGDEAGFVQPGQPVQIKFAAFPFSRFGSGEGAVRLISADSFLTGSGVSGNTATSSGNTSNAVFTGQQPNSPYFFDVRVSLDRLALKYLPKDTHIVPGMPVEADIKVGQRTVWQYLIERMLPILKTGMREPT
jgi:HlyD family secretion protein